MVLNSYVKDKYLPDNYSLTMYLVPLNLMYSPKKCILPKDYTPKFDINSFISHINNNYNNINYIFQ